MSSVVKKRFETGKMTKIAMLSAVAYGLMFLELAIPIFPGFLKLDISDVPAVIAGFAMGPMAAVTVELIKNLLHATMTTTGGVGELANFVIGVAMVAPASWIYMRNKTKKGALIGMVVGTLSMAIVGALANLLVLLPFYAQFMPLEEIVAWSAQANNAIVDIKTLVLFGITPFNIFKGVVVFGVTYPIYKRLSGILR